MSYNAILGADMIAWRDVAGFEGVYQISSEGRIKRVKAASGTSVGALLKVRLNSYGYSIATLWNGKKRRDLFVHRLVLETFVGECPSGMEGCHNDGNPLNNCLENLRWDTYAANNQNKVAHGTDNKGERHGRAKLSERDVLKVKEMIREKASNTEIARLFGVDCSQISNIKLGKRWAHVC